MSKIGKQPVIIPEGITAIIDGDVVRVRGTQGELTVSIPRGVRAALNERELVFTLVGDSVQARAAWGTVRALAQNAVVGLTKGFEKTLILEGVGYRITKEGNDLSMTLGFSHPVKYTAVPGITFTVEKNSVITIKGFDRAVVGQVAAEIRALKKPEPYKGKGFRYSTEVILRKAGKKAATAIGTGA
ncbi:MAG: 50S ribosomal protein L6 [Patescibacteria group bacterium]